ncbi:MAG: relaxase/mobilization nuclease domain-containing protein, partial [Desulfovibrio sp.]|uniref:relaxase/mobilization nuclease domain-containing protein n=1 Tax=Desulfovibrio sp. TaxID=885 RepID=UPI001A687936
NRVHPDTLQVIQPHKGFDIEAAHKIVALIEKKQGWQPQKEARYRVDENNQVVRNELRKKQPPSSKAQDFENFTGEKSAQRIAQQRGRKILEEARSWQELHDGLREVGLRFERKGSGGIVFVGDKAVKASSIDRRFSMAKLCKRLGEFIAGEYDALIPKIEPEPVSRIAEDQWREYRKARLIEAERWKVQKAEFLKQNAAEIAVFKAKQKERRKQAYANLALHGEEFVSIAKFFLPFQQSQELMDQRRKLAKMPKMACGRFKDWLRQRSPWLADIWRLRRTLQPGTEYGHFHEGYFPRIGKLQRPVVPYREMVRRRYADMKVGVSRLEVMLALHLRCAGYLRKQVEEEMQRHTLVPLQSDPLAPKLTYLQRVLDYAFGAHGDKIILDNHIGKPDVERFNKEAGIIEYYSKYAVDSENQRMKNWQSGKMT